MDESEGTIKTYSEWIINWCWYLRVEHHDDNTVTILAHYRVHMDDKNHPKTFGDFRLIEDKDRIVQKAKIGNLHRGNEFVDYDVRNKQHIFSYSFSK